jgi:hypothetical protein
LLCDWLAQFLSEPADRQRNLALTERGQVQLKTTICQTVPEVISAMLGGYRAVGLPREANDDVWLRFLDSCT